MKGACFGSTQRVIAWYHFLGLAGAFLAVSGPCPSFALGTPGGAAGPGWPGAGGGDTGVPGEPGTTCASNSGSEEAAAPLAQAELSAAVHKTDRNEARRPALAPVAECSGGGLAPGFTRATARRIEAAGRYPPRTHRPWSRCETGSMSGGSDPRRSQILRPSMHRAAWCRSQLAAIGKHAILPTILVRESPLR